jgi:molecular chaperone Hsp33
MSVSNDLIVRALTDDGGFRVIGARTTRTVQGVLGAQDPPTDIRDVFGQFLTCAVLTRETMSPGQRVQAILRGPDQKKTLLADTHPGGKTRGLLTGRDEPASILGEGALLQVVRTLVNNELHQGIVEAPKDGGVSGAFMSYMQRSEQITTMIAASCYFENDELMVSGGYCIQVLPEIAKGPLAVMAARIEGFNELDQALETSAGDVDELLGEILYGIPFTVVERTELEYGCTCNEIRVMGALTTLGPAEIEELANSSKVIELQCDYCKTDYKISPAKLKGLLEES